MNKSKSFIIAIAAVVMFGGIAQAVNPSDSQFSSNRNSYTAQEKDRAIDRAEKKANDNFYNNIDKKVSDAKDIDDLKSKIATQYKESMKTYCEDLKGYFTAEEKAYCEEWVNLDPTAYGAGTDIVRLMEKSFYLPNAPKEYYSFVPMKDLFVDSVSHDQVYYTNPTMKSAVTRYKQGNYTGCLQELYDYIKKHPNDPYAYYYMGLAYTKIGETKAAQNCYQKVINCNVHGQLLKSALKRRDCLTGGMFCTYDEVMAQLETGLNEVMNKTDISADDELDKFINSPYKGNGFSPELQKQYQQKELENVQKTINRKKELNEQDYENIRRIENMNKSESISGEKLAMVTGKDASLTPSDADVSDAIDVLRRSGLNITLTPSVESNVQTSYEQQMPEVFTPNQDLQAMQMLLGNSNSQNSDPMMSMLPYMMKDNGKNIDPQVMQAMMMNSMMSGLGGLNSTDNK